MTEQRIKNWQESQFSRLDGTGAARSGMSVEVAYAKPEVQVILPVMVESGTTVEDIIRLSGVLERFPEIDLAQVKVGIFSKPCGLYHTPRRNDRIEIYRPLIADPKQARCNRAAKKARQRDA